MQSPQSNTSRELFVVLRDLRSHFGRYQDRITPLSRAQASQVVSSVNVFHLEDKDLALLCLTFEAGEFDLLKFEALIHLATKAGLSIIDPERFSETDREFFYQDYLRRFSISATDLSSPSVALKVLGRQLNLSGRKQHHLPRELEFEAGGQATKEMSIEFLDAARKKSMAPMDFYPVGDAPSLAKTRRNNRAETMPASPASRAARKPLPLPLALTSKANPDQPVPVPSPRRKRISSVPPISTTEEQEVVRIRFQRGDTWMPGRLRNLTTKEVRLAASAAPPSGSILRISISIGERNAVLTGTVVEVINTEGSTDGSTTFRCEFRDVGKHEQARLVALLRQAKKIGLSLTPPPARRDRRFAISWPLTIVNGGQRFSASALDISENGLFLATTTMLRSNKLVFGMPIDREGVTIRGRATVARKVSEQMARARGLNLGYGLQIEDIHQEDLKAYEEFLLRVRSRSQRHILVAGEGDRSTSLAECMRSAGYAVSKANSVEMMMQRTQFESNAPDLAMMDAASLSSNAQKHFRAAFRENGVPLVLADEHSPEDARHRVDKMVKI